MNKVTKPSILAVDDTPENLNLLKKILTASGYNVRALPHGRLVLRSALSNPPDLILLDIMMPDMDGYEICAQLKAEARTRDIPVIFISALQENVSKLRAFSEGGVDYVSKPFHAEEVLARVRTHLHLRAMQQDLEVRNRDLAALNHELSEAKTKAEAANRAKSAFLANMSHELRTPLNAVLGFAQIMARDRGLSGKHQRYVGNIQHGGEFLLELLNDVLDLAKIEAGRFECILEAWDTRRFFAELGEVFRTRAEQKDLFFRYEEPTPLPRMLHSDPRRLRQIAMNLLGNAVKFTRRGGITLRTGFADDKLVLEVADTGPGIPADMLDRIFEPFQQAGDSAQKIQGTGLGLSITRKLAEMMDGTVSVTSTEGRGSTFRVEIQAQALATPDDNARAENAPEAVAYKRTDNGDGPLRLLICDDAPDNLEVLEEILKPLGFDVLTTSNGKECIATAQQQVPDAVLLDLYMPELNGFETVRALREMPACRDTPIISVSADAFSETRNQSLAAGSSEHLAKPIKVEKLTEALGALLPLTWEYAAEFENSRFDNELEKLPAALNEQLSTALEQGNIRRVRELARQLEQDQCCPSLAHKISELAQSFELDELERLLGGELG